MLIWEERLIVKKKLAKCNEDLMKASVCKFYLTGEEMRCKLQEKWHRINTGFNKTNKIFYGYENENKLSKFVILFLSTSSIVNNTLFVNHP